MMNITDLIGRSPIDARTVEDVQSAGVSVRKDKRDELSASDRLKLSKAAREGGVTNFRSLLLMEQHPMTLNLYMIYRCK